MGSRSAIPSRDIVCHVSTPGRVSKPRLSRGKVALFLVFWTVLGGFFAAVLVVVTHDERIDFWVVVLVLTTALATGVGLGFWVKALAARATSKDTLTSTRPSPWFFVACAGLGSSLAKSGEAVIVAMAFGISLCAGVAFLTAHEAWTTRHDQSAA